MNFMETRETYTCPSCRWKSSWPLTTEEMVACARMRYERSMNRFRLAIIVVAAIAVPLLISALVECL